jgi:hypothetical protein
MNTKNMFYSYIFNSFSRNISLAYSPINHKNQSLGIGVGFPLSSIATYVTEASVTFT